MKISPHQTFCMQEASGRYLLLPLTSSSLKLMKKEPISFPTHYVCSSSSSSTKSDGSSNSHDNNRIAAQNKPTILRLNLLSIVTAVTPTIVLQGKRRLVIIPNQVPVIVVTVVILETREVTTANHLTIKMMISI